MKIKKLNVNFKEGQIVECMWGLNKGNKFIVIANLSSHNMYSLKIADNSNDKYYGYDDSQLKEA